MEAEGKRRRCKASSIKVRGLQVDGLIAENDSKSSYYRKVEPSMPKVHFVIPMMSLA